MTVFHGVSRTAVADPEGTVGYRSLFDLELIGAELTAGHHLVECGGDASCRPVPADSPSASGKARGKELRRERPGKDAVSVMPDTVLHRLQA